jgi:hypothetical protein
MVNGKVWVRLVGSEVRIGASRRSFPPLDIQSRRCSKELASVRDRSYMSE